ncbi:MAG: DUF2231 domain-containing protein [Planctomycetota bacterium]
MLPEPLHPAVVHFPIAFAFLVPLVAITALIVGKRWQGPVQLWLFVVVLQGLVCTSAFVANETGEEERVVVEDSVAAAPLDAHQEAGDLFHGVAWGVLIVAAVGLIRSKWQPVVQVVVVIGCIAVAVLAARAGSLGGDLVYEHGAAAHYNK